MLAPGSALAGVGGSDCESPIEAKPTAETPPETPSEAAPDADPSTTPTTAAPPPDMATALGRKSLRVKCLDEKLVDEFGRARVRKGVQPRDFRKALHLSLSLHGGGWGGDLLDTAWQAGGTLAFWATEHLGFDGQFTLVPMTLRIERSASSFSGQNRYPDGMVENLAYVAMGHVLLSAIHTKLRAGRDRIVHGDFVLFAGAGRAIHDTARGAAFDIGASLYLFPTRWLSVRLDVGDTILAQEALGSRRISNNLVASVGLGFWIPLHRSVK